jgi:flagellar biosynthetic protein FliQ
MTADQIVYIGRDAMLVTLLAAAPMLLSGMVVGLIISVFQSVTQIQEITLTFIPKIVVVFISFIVFLPWIMSTVLGFVRPLLANAHLMVR